MADVVRSLVVLFSAYYYVKFVYYLMFSDSPFCAVLRCIFDSAYLFQCYWILYPRCFHVFVALSWSMLCCVDGVYVSERFSRVRHATGCTP
jgi:hypothetical protein